MTSTTEKITLLIYKNPHYFDTVQMKDLYFTLSENKDLEDLVTNNKEMYV